VPARMAFTDIHAHRKPRLVLPGIILYHQMSPAVIFILFLAVNTPFRDGSANSCIQLPYQADVARLSVVFAIGLTIKAALSSDFFFFFFFFFSSPNWRHI
jgi:hypothetical protein